MRYTLLIVAAFALAGPAFAAHDVGTPLGQAAAGGVDRNHDGKINGKDYAPGQSAAEPAAMDNNGDGVINAKDYAPGQIPAPYGKYKPKSKYAPDSKY